MNINMLHLIAACFGYQSSRIHNNETTRGQKFYVSDMIRIQCFFSGQCPQVHTIQNYIEKKTIGSHMCFGVKRLRQEKLAKYSLHDFSHSSAHIFRFIRFNFVRHRQYWLCSSYMWLQRSEPYTINTCLFTIQHMSNNRICRIYSCRT